MPYSQFAEQALLDAMFGNCVGQWATAMTAPLATQTTATTRGAAGSGNMDETPAAEPIIVGTPGSSNTQNQYTNLDIITLTSATATSVTFASQTIAKTRAVADFIFTMSTITGGAAMLNNTLYFGVSTQAVAGATQANVLSNEPTIGTGNYGRIPVLNTVTNWTDATAASPSVKVSIPAFAFAQSSAAWSTTTTFLVQGFICDSPTGTTIGTNVNLLGFGALGTQQQVNAGSITLQFTAAGVSITLT